MMSFSTTKISTKYIASIALCLGMLLGVAPIYAWTVHGLITNPALSSIERAQRSVTVKSLNAFLLKHASELESVLAKEEKWSREKLEWYKDRPDALAFKSSGERKTIVRRFLQSIRVNPLLPSFNNNYLQLLPSQSSAGRAPVRLRTLTVFKEFGATGNMRFVRLPSGSKVKALDVVSTASDEPDLGMDIGLFDNSKTAHGKTYGFGKQPFGNPNLEYGSQAPFHMGFYHEAGIIYLAAGFLKQTYPEYRIHLYKALSTFAFSKGEDYWGWRFMGWGLHYVGDLSQPYHSRALPGIGATRMLCTSILAMVGASGFKKDAIQLVSNRHTVVDSLQNQIMMKESKEGNKPDSMAKQVVRGDGQVTYTHDVIREVLSKKAEDKSGELDEVLEDSMPERFVSDPSFELSGSPEGKRLIAEIEKKQGPKAVVRLKRMLILLLRSNTSVAQAYAKGIFAAAK